MQDSVCVCERVCAYRLNPALFSQFYQSIQRFVHHVSSLSTINGDVSCDTVHLIKVVCLTVFSVASQFVQKDVSGCLISINYTLR